MHHFLRIALMLQIVLLTACASELPGWQGNEIDPPPGHKDEISVSVDTIAEFSSERYRALFVSFVNNSDRWIRVESTNISFPHLSPKAEILLGRDLETYIGAVHRRNTIHAYNKALIVGSLYALGAVTAISGAASGNGELFAAGAASSVGAMSYLTVDAIIASKNRAQFQDSLPQGHFLKPFDIPPKLSASSWVILSMPPGSGYKDALVEFKEIDQPKRIFKVEEPRKVKKETDTQRLSPNR